MSSVFYWFGAVIMMAGAVWFLINNRADDDQPRYKRSLFVFISLLSVVSGFLLAKSTTDIMLTRSLLLAVAVLVVNATIAAFILGQIFKQLIPTGRFWSVRKALCVSAIIWCILFSLSFSGLFYLH
jgi:hypothetical protein